jgi:tRNA threonylcarbamoyladenosine biosynthesis protein TsaB
VLLAVETATRVLSVALLEGEALRAELSTVDPRAHAERLLPAIDALLAQAGVGLDAVGAFAVSIGPGSFTGLRIGLATVKGLAFDTGRPVAAVPTLAALAAGAGASEPTAALLDARRGEVYAALWDPQSEALLLEGVYAPAELAALLPPRCAVLAAEDAGSAAAEVVARLGAGARLLAGPGALARAWNVGRLGARLLARGSAVAAEALVPRYLRRAEAEARRTGEALERFDSPKPLP